MPAPIAQKSAIIHAARIQPGAVSLRRPVGGGAGAWSCVGGMPVRLDVGHFAPFEESTR